MKSLVAAIRSSMTLLAPALKTRTDSRIARRRGCSKPGMRGFRSQKRAMIMGMMLSKASYDSLSPKASTNSQQLQTRNQRRKSGKRGGKRKLQNLKRKRRHRSKKHN